jgi:predicted SnoaL-like aldol condensation-catalyzing enzyme
MPQRKPAMGPMPREQMTPNQRAYMQYIDALLADDPATEVRKALTPGFIAHDLPEGHNDLESLIAFRERLHTVLPDQEVKVRVMLEVGDQVAGYATLTQTDPTTGQPFSFGILDLVRVESGKVAARWGTFEDPKGTFLDVRRKLLSEQARRQ